jgi:hypothetical protein
MMTDPFERISPAIKMGPMAVLRLRAEALLQNVMDLTDREQEELGRIASAPREEDGEFLDSFDDPHPR